MAIKVIFIGPMGAGKTTAIRAISDIEPVTTEAKNTDRETSDKDTTTVAMEYGEVALEEEGKLLLFGIPGQRHFEFIWPIVAKGALGAVLLVDASHPDWQDDFQFFVSKFSDLVSTGALVVGINRANDKNSVEKALTRLCQDLGIAVPYLFSDPRDKSDVSELLEMLVLNAELDGAF